MKTGRRNFIKTVAVGSAAAGTTLRGQKSGKSLGEYPRVYRGRQLSMIAFPLGGIGAGTLSLGGRGNFRDWEMFNKPNKGKRPNYGFHFHLGAGARPKTGSHGARIAIDAAL